MGWLGRAIFPIAMLVAVASCLSVLLFGLLLITVQLR